MSAEPQFRFCTSADGARISFLTAGTGPPLLYVRVFWASMDSLLSMPIQRAYFDALSARMKIITFDRRGSGQSSRDVERISPDADASDIGAVADAAGLKEFSLMADFDGLAGAARYAAEHRARVERLVVWASGYSRALNLQWIRSMREDWSYARRVWAGMVYPNGPVDLQRAFSQRTKETVSGEMASRRFEEFGELDVAPLVSRVTAPALVLGREQPHAAREIAMNVLRMFPNAEVRFVPGEDVTPIAMHGPIVRAVEEFLGAGSEPAVPAAAPSRSRTLNASRTIIYTDIEGNTDMLTRLGDDAWRAVLQEHERITRELLAMHGGAEIKTMGDGFMASFDSATSAIECAIGLQRAFAARNEIAAEPVLVRVGLNAGEPIEEDEDLFGTAVTLAARIIGQGAGGEILVSDLVRGLVAGKGFLFGDRGEFIPRGFDENIRLWDVRWRD